MNQQEKKMRKYLTSISRRLNLPKDVKERVMNDLRSSIQGRREAGQSDGDIFRDLGTPARAAAELNSQLKEYTYIKSPWRWACLVLAVLSGASLVLGGLLGLLSFSFNQALSKNIEIIGGADGPTAIFIATAGISWEQLLLTLLLLIMGVLGFFKLSRCPRK